MGFAFVTYCYVDVLILFVVSHQSDFSSLRDHEDHDAETQLFIFGGVPSEIELGLWVQHELEGLRDDSFEMLLQLFHLLDDPRFEGVVLVCHFCCVLLLLDFLLLQGLMGDFGRGCWS